MATYSRYIGPQCESIGSTLFEGKVIGIQSGNLATVVTRLVCVLVVHVVRNAYFREQTRMNAQVVGPFFTDSSKLMREAVSYGIFSNLNSKCWRKVFAS